MFLLFIYLINYSFFLFIYLFIYLLFFFWGGGGVAGRVQGDIHKTSKYGINKYLEDKKGNHTNQRKFRT